MTNFYAIQHDGLGLREAGGDRSLHQVDDEVDDRAWLEIGRPGAHPTNFSEASDSHRHLTGQPAMPLLKKELVVRHETTKAPKPTASLDKR